MKITSILFDAGNSLLRLVYEGPFSLPEAQMQFIDTLDAAVKHRARKILVDGRAVTGEPLLIQRFLYSEFAADAVGTVCERGLTSPPQFAYVLLEPVLDPGRFGQIVALNRGMNLQVFDNLPDAEQWLDMA